MTREDIRLTLEAIEERATRSDAAKAARWAPVDLTTRTLADLAAILADQEERLIAIDLRLRLLEPCPKLARGVLHRFEDLGDGKGWRCEFCGQAQAEGVRR